MKLDTKSSFGEICGSQEAVKEHIHRIRKHLLSRDMASKWASRLRFIAMPGETRQGYDGPDNQESAGDGEGSDACEDGLNGDMEHLTSSTTFTCLCINLPYFPQGGVSTFVVTASEPADLPDCLHYVAISYCWESQSDTTPEHAYSVQTSRGTRTSRAPKEILDRAISYAAYYDVRLIWIDQKCIEQDDPEDQEFGIQSMDLVYQQASNTAALLTTYIDSQAYMDALFKAIGGENFADLSDFSCAVEVLELLAKDRWLSRAWCFQEAASAGESMVLLIRCCRDLTPQDDFARTTYMQIPGEIEITLEDLYQALSWVSAWPLVTPGVPPDLVERSEAVTTALYKTCPMAFRERTDDRYACNAAQALHLLAHRSNSRIPDRLAILANLCNFPLRLNTADLERAEESMGFEYSFSVCAYILAIVNGDISLLVGGKVQHEKELVPGVERNIQGQGDMSCSWVPPLNTVLDGLPFVEEFEEQFLLPGLEISDEGLSILGYLWKVDTQVSLTSLQQRLSTRWCDESSKQQWLYSHQAQTDLAREIRWSILCELYSKGLAAVANCLWYNIRLTTSSVPERFGDMINPSVNSSGLPMPHSMGREDEYHTFAKNSHSPDGLRWIIQCVVRDGFLWCGRRALDSGSDLDGLRCIFDCEGPGYVLTPYSGRLESLRGLKHRRRPISWITHRSSRVSDGSEVLDCKNLVRGIWQGEGMSPKRFIVS
ncbi:hypothetical protein FGG08_004526 [Glutinoglossum americanum]|uniref:Heterokaryon incompatibility domain-containing protein n=1 Tax=Glutinoglossum americanum TaxID=1670608 RepID=A0A9P8KX06_9PEZI|nr:hypothetical protein FGG08_004526 [Glutinoglossum americanum]